MRAGNSGSFVTSSKAVFPVKGIVTIVDHKTAPSLIETSSSISSSFSSQELNKARRKNKKHLLAPKVKLTEFAGKGDKLQAFFSKGQSYSMSTNQELNKGSHVKGVNYKKSLCSGFPSDFKVTETKSNIFSLHKMNQNASQDSMIKHGKCNIINNTVNIGCDYRTKVNIENSSCSSNIGKIDTRTGKCLTMTENLSGSQYARRGKNVQGDSVSLNTPTLNKNMLSHKFLPVSTTSTPRHPLTSSATLSSLSQQKGSTLSDRPHSGSVPSFPNTYIPTYPLQTKDAKNSEPGSPSRTDVKPTLPVPMSSTRTKSGPLRRGKWTEEEETYVARVIHDFNLGYLNTPAGTTLRTYLSDKLNCDPMRITKKFTGDACIGKRVFHPVVRCPSITALINTAQGELRALERRWRRRLEMQQRESAKKAAASVAASGRHNIHTHLTHIKPCGQQSLLVDASNNNQFDQTSLATKTASWLDRANAILSSQNSSMSHQDHHQGSVDIPAYVSDYKKELQEVQRLINEGPIIQKTYPMLLEGVDGVVSATPITSNLPVGMEFINKNNSLSEVSNVSPMQLKSCTKRKFCTASSTSGKTDHAHYNKSHCLPIGADCASVNLTSSEATAYFSDSLQPPTYRCTDNSQTQQKKRLCKSFSTSHLPSNQYASFNAKSENKLTKVSSEGAIEDAAEDAATLMGFFTSVREKVASESSPPK